MASPLAVRLAPWSVVLLSASCQVPLGFVREEVPDVAIIPAAEAARFRLRAEPLEHRFGPGRDGTDVVVEFLAAARERGAGWVSGLEIHLVTIEGNQPVDCVTRLGPSEEVRVHHETITTPSRVEYEGRMRPVTRMVPTSERECRTVQRPHMVTRTEYRHEYDSIARTSRSAPHTRTVTEYRSEQECHHVMRSRMVTTYEYQTEMKWIPPRTEVIARRHSRWSLVESAPACAPLGPGQIAQNRIVGVAHHRPASAKRAR